MSANWGPRFVFYKDKFLFFGNSYLFLTFGVNRNKFLFSLKGKTFVPVRFLFVSHGRVGPCSMA